MGAEFRELYFNLSVYNIECLMNSRWWTTSIACSCFINCLDLEGFDDQRRAKANKSSLIDCHIDSFINRFACLSCKSTTGISVRCGWFPRFWKPTWKPNGNQWKPSENQWKGTFLHLDFALTLMFPLGLQWFPFGFRLGFQNIGNQPLLLNFISNQLAACPRVTESLFFPIPFEYLHTKNIQPSWEYS